MAHKEQRRKKLMQQKDGAQRTSKEAERTTKEEEEEGEEGRKKVPAWRRMFSWLAAVSFPLYLFCTLFLFLLCAAGMGCVFVGGGA